MSHRFPYFEWLRGRAPAALICLAVLTSGCGDTATTSVGPSPTKCAVTAIGPTDPIGAGGGTASIVISAQPECTWTAVAEGAWISGLTPGGGQGPGKVEFSAAVNPSGVARSAHIVLNDLKVPVQQQGAACSIEVSPRTSEVSAQGETETVSVATIGGCPWTAVSDSSWLTITSGGSGTGPGSVTYRAEANPGPGRSGTLTIAGQSVTVVQPAVGTAPSACEFTVSPTIINAPASGTDVPVSVAAEAACSWTAAASVPWITIAPAGGSGAAPVRVSVGPNTGAARTSAVVVAGRTVVVQQQGTACSIEVSPATSAVGAPGGSGVVSIATSTGCPWTAVSDSSWLTITSAAVGTGPGTVSYRAEANTGPGRTGTLNIGGQVVSVVQAAGATAPPPCTFAVSPTVIDAPAGGTNASVSVATEANCAWTAASSVPWITVAPAGGSGPAPVQVSVEPNSGAARNAAVVIAGETVTVNQAAGCSYDVAPTSQTFTQAGGTGGPVTVTAPSGCPWTATSSASWLAIESGESGTGNGSVTFTVASNTGEPRAADLTIAGRSFSVSQGGSCSFTVSPLLVEELPPAGGPAPAITVTAPALCSWTATSNTSWITITGGTSGSGDGTVTFTVAMNTGGPRTGSLTVAGSTVTVKQLKKD